MASDQHRATPRTETSHSTGRRRLLRTALLSLGGVAAAGAVTSGRASAAAAAMNTETAHTATKNTSLAGDIPEDAVWTVADTPGANDVATTRIGMRGSVGDVGTLPKGDLGVVGTANRALGRPENERPVGVLGMAQEGSGVRGTAPTGTGVAGKGRTGVLAIAEDFTGEPLFRETTLALEVRGNSMFEGTAVIIGGPGPDGADAGSDGSIPPRALGVFGSVDVSGRTRIGDIFIDGIAPAGPRSGFPQDEPILIVSGAVRVEGLGLVAGEVAGGSGFVALAVEGAGQFGGEVRANAFVGRGGPPGFRSAGSGVIPKGSRRGTVSVRGFTPAQKVLVTLTKAGAGGAALSHIEKKSGAFDVVLDGTTQGEVSFDYFTFRAAR